MIFSRKFVCATHEMSTLEKAVPAPYMRRELHLDSIPESAKITVCALGFYEMYVNGKNITRGMLSPWITNPNQIMPYDFYDIKEYLTVGDNVIAFVLGCGMQNSPGGYVWCFDTARFASSPKLAFGLELKINGEYTVTEADGRVLCHPSPILFNDLRMGERYDARLEIPMWNEVGLNTSDWTAALPATLDAGEPMHVTANPIKIHSTLHPVSIHREGDSYIYDFGENNTGITELEIMADEGQRVILDHGEWLKKRYLHAG